jgi:uncharacterized membrane protein
MSNKQRYEFIDLIRGFTVFLMIIFHFCYDLHAFRFVTIDFINDKFWWTFPRVIVFIFFIAVGMSLSLSHCRAIKWRSFNQRLTKLVAYAVIISLVTYFAFPKGWIYFGTLHCIALASIIALPLVNRPRIALVATILCLAPEAFGYGIPFFKMAHRSLDYISLFPWLGIVTLGIFLYHRGLHRLSVPAFPGKKTLQWLGKHSLKVYLLHQPILFSLVYLASKALPN